MRQRKIPEINTSASADIAFLMLVFFLLTMALEPTRGIKRKLPPPTPEDAITKKADIRKRDLLVISIDSGNNIYCDDVPVESEELKSRIKSFVSNPTDEADLPEKKEIDFPEIGRVRVTANHMIVLKPDRNSDYQTYILIQDKLTEAYSELREEFAVKYYGKSIKKLSDSQQEVIMQVYPMKLSELETL